MATYNFLSTIFNTVDAATSAYISTAVAAATTAVAPVFHQMFILYVILWGFAMYKGVIQEPVLDGAFRLAKVALIMQLAIGSGLYSGLIAANIQALPDFLVGVFGGGGTTTGVQTTLDDILSNALETGDVFWEKAGIWDGDFGAYLQAFTVWIFAVIACGYAAFLIVLAKIGLAIFVGIGPIAMACLLFQGTNKFFEAWVGQVLNFAFTSAFAIGVIKLLFGMYASTASNTLTAASSDTGFLNIISLVLLSVILMLVLMQVQQFASAFAGGAAVSTMGAVSALTRMGSNAARGLRPRNIAAGMRHLKQDLRATGIPTAARWAHRKMTGGNKMSKAA